MPAEKLSTVERAEGVRSSTMDQGNARFMKRKVKAGTIEVDPECTRAFPAAASGAWARRTALTAHPSPCRAVVPRPRARAASTLIVNYEVEATVLGDMGEAIVADRKSNQKLIRLKTLNENTNIPRLVDEILEKCKLIHESKRALVEELLRDLQRQQLHGGPVAGAARRARAGADEGGGGPSDGGEVASDGGEVASIGRLGEYIDGCYEGVEHAVRATGLLLQLAREPTQLETLVHDDRLLGCLTRLLNDEGKKSMELGLNIVSVLYAFSAYSDFHPPLLEFKVGSLVMDVVDLEIKRHALRERERASAAAAAAESAEEGARAKVRGRKAEKLLYVCLHLLLNLAEDIHTERKMCNHGIVPILTAMLSRQNADLLILVLVFLKKLAIFGENADEMARARLADKLVAFVPNKHEGVLEHVLHLLYNLAFHPKCAAQLGRAGLTPKLLSLLRKGRHRLLAVRLLYQLSAQDSERAKMTQSVPMLVGTVINTPDAALVPPEVLALLVNLMTNAENARACAKARGALRGLVALGVRSQHVLSLKALRNMALHTAEEHCEELARAYGGELLELPAAAQTADVQLEALGLLAELPLCAIDDLPQLLPPSRALQIAAQLLSPHSGAEEDAVLEAVRFVGTCAEHPGCTPLLLRTAGLLPSLLGVLGEQQEDDEIVLATVHACLRLLHDQVRAPAARHAGRAARAGRALRLTPSVPPLPPPRRRRASGCSRLRAVWCRSCSSCCTTSACQYGSSLQRRSTWSRSTTRPATGCPSCASASSRRTTASGSMRRRRTTWRDTRHAQCTAGWLLPAHPRARRDG